jgi:transcriptional regulator with XRE-family HTH domain
MIIKNLRLQNGWSQEKLAELTNLSIRTIQRIEKEDKASLESLKSLALAFEMDIKELQEKINNKDNFVTKQNTKQNRTNITIKIFILVNLILFAINMLTGTKHLWFIYPLLGWGIPLFYKRYKSSLTNK